MNVKPPRVWKSIRPPMQEPVDTVSPMLDCIYHIRPTNMRTVDMVTIARPVVEKSHPTPVLAKAIGERCTSWIIVPTHSTDILFGHTAACGDSLHEGGISKEPPVSRTTDQLLVVKPRNTVTFDKWVMTFKISRMPSSYFAAVKDDNHRRIAITSKIVSFQKTVTNWIGRVVHSYCTEPIF